MVIAPSVDMYCAQGATRLVRGCTQRYEGRRASMNEIVVGVDPSETARRAAEQAAELASALATTLHLVTCIDRGHTVSVAVGGDQFRSDSLSEADQFLDDVARRLPHDKITRAAVVGDPAKVLVEEAKRLGARMIVVGNRRVQGAARVLGSVASDVAKHAGCDVLIVNTTGAGAKPNG
jgi:nucleotide-binding universal stress UspA family protein